MKKLLIATAAVALATVGTAGAADLPASPAYTKAPPPPAPVASWTGCYADAGLGYGMWNQDISLNGNLLNTAGAVIGTVTTPTTTDGGRGWLGRVGVGCDYQAAPQFVIGAFGDWDFMSLKGTNLPNELVLFPSGATSPVADNVKMTNAGYAGIRLGYLPYPNLLTFVSGGWTGGHFQESNLYPTLPLVSFGANVLTYPASYNVNGWFLGGGYEYRVPWLPGLFWKTEYRFAQYQSVNLVETLNGVATGNIQSNQSYVQTVTSSLVWRFNWTGPR